MQTTKVYMLPIKDVSLVSDNYCKKYFPKRFINSKKFIFAEDKLRSIGVGVLLKEVLDLCENDIKVGTFGKPYSTSISEKFSISHSGDYVVLAVSNENVGVDIEKLDSVDLSVAENVFTAEELWWMNMNPKDGFFKLWTMKESISKALGLGLSMEYEKVSVLPLVIHHTMDYNGSVFFGESILLPKYCISVCAESKTEVTVIDYHI